MADLEQMKCTACRGDEPALSDEQIASLLIQVPEWEVVVQDRIKRLERTFTFEDFKTALAFTNQVGALAEAADHHPTIVTEWGRVKVTWWTHKIGGLHTNDFIMAARTDAAYASGEH